MIGSCLKRLGGTCPQTQNERLQQPIHPKLPFSHPAKPSCWSVKYLVHSGKTLEKVLSKATGIFKLAIGIETTMPHRTGCRGRYSDFISSGSAFYRHCAGHLWQRLDCNRVDSYYAYEHRLEMVVFLLCRS